MRDPAPPKGFYPPPPEPMPDPPPPPQPPPPTVPEKKLLPEEIRLDAIQKEIGKGHFRVLFWGVIIGGIGCTGFPGYTGAYAFGMLLLVAGILSAVLDMRAKWIESKFPPP